MFIELFNFSFFSITGVEKEKKMYGEPPLPFYQLTEVRQFLLSSTDQSFYITVIQVYAPISNAKEAEVE